jgi:hypothetical protein
MLCRNLRSFTVAQKLADDLMSLGPALRISAVDTDGRCRCRELAAVNAAGGVAEKGDGPLIRSPWQGFSL